MRSQETTGNDAALESQPSIFGKVVTQRLVKEALRQEEEGRRRFKITKIKRQALEASRIRATAMSKSLRDGKHSANTSHQLHNQSEGEPSPAKKSANNSEENPLQHRTREYTRSKQATAAEMGVRDLRSMHSDTTQTHEDLQRRERFAREVADLIGFDSAYIGAQDSESDGDLKSAEPGLIDTLDADTTNLQISETDRPNISPKKMRLQQQGFRAVLANEAY